MSTIRNCWIIGAIDMPDCYTESLRRHWPESPPDLRINLDHDMRKFFVRSDTNNVIVDRPSVKDHDLNRDIYFRPSASPLISVADAREGSCFSNLYVPTASWCWYPDDRGTHRVVPLPHSLALDPYVDELDSVILHEIRTVYQRHGSAVLAFSGGIDSMVLLAYIMHLELLDRTTLHVFDNVTQDHPSCLHRDTHTRQAVTDLLAFLKPTSMGWYQTDVSDVARVFNSGSLADIKCYASRCVLDHYQDRAVIFGWHGNQALLHKDIFLDEIRLQQPHWGARLQAHIAGKGDFYTRGLKHYDTRQSPIGLEHRHLVIKPWARLDHVHGNRVYAPLGAQANLLLTRMLDFSRIHPDVVLDAEIGRELIRRRCGSLETYLSHETVRENDNLSGFDLPKDLIDLDTVRIPQHLRHHSDGVDYLQQEIASIQHRGYLALNSAVSIRSLQYIAQEFA